VARTRLVTADLPNERRETPGSGVSWSSCTPAPGSLTTQEAADLLGISRPTLIRLLGDGKIPFEQPGRHRRIRLDDLLTYRDQRRQERSETLDELVRQTDALGLYDEEAPETR
jgi:excisionase family DNA binding protein